MICFDQKEKKKTRIRLCLLRLCPPWKERQDGNRRRGVFRMQKIGRECEGRGSGSGKHVA